VNILASKINHLGDAVSFLPTLRGLSKYVPEVNLTVLCTPMGKEIFDGAVAGLNFIPLNYEETRGLLSLGLLLPSVQRLRGMNFSLSCHSYDEPSFSYLLATVLRIRRRVGFEISTSKGQLLISESIPYDKGRNVVDVNFDLVRHITGNWNLKPQRVPISYSDEQHKSIEKHLAKLGLNSGSSFIVIHHGAKQPYREWGIESYLQVVEHLERCIGFPVVFVTDQKRIVSLLSSYRVVTGLSLKELACLLSMATLFIGNNSGPMHIAAAMGTPCIVVQGPTSPAWEIFWDDVPHETVKASHLACVPCERLLFNPGKCFNRERPHGCMKELSVGMVTDHVIRLLGDLNRLKGNFLPHFR